MKKNCRKRPARLGPADTSLPELQVKEDNVALSDEVALERAKTQWLLGEWTALSELNIKALRHHPERDYFALLAASAHQQLGNHEKAREYTQLALEWGCPHRVAAQILLAGVHNTLGRIAALQKDDSCRARHFEAAVAIEANSETALVGHARLVREMSRMGLLLEAASLVGKKLQETKTDQIRPEQQQAQIKVLEIELSLLHHELALAQQRQQLFHSSEADSASNTSQGSEEQWLEALKKKAVSQLGQDLWVLEKTSYKRGGFFVEFGATDGVMLSNTWLLEKEFGWKGICAEPNPKFFDALQKNRGCFVSNACIGATTGEEVDFLLADVFGGMAKHASSDMHALTRQAYAEKEESVLKLRTVSLHDFLIECGAPQKIDYLSIDTEGSELEIIKNFPFDQWDIALLTVEHNYSSSREEIFNTLKNYGYDRLEMQFDDWYFKVF